MRLMYKNMHAQHHNISIGSAYSLLHSMVVSVPSACSGCISSSLLRIGFLLVEKAKKKIKTC